MEKKNKWYHPFKKEDYKKKERKETEPATPKDFPTAQADMSIGEPAWKTVFKVLLVAALFGIAYLIYTYGF